MRKTLTAVFAWTTLMGGTCVLNAVAGALFRSALVKLCPTVTDTVFWRGLAIGYSLLSPLWVLILLSWFRGSRTAVQA